MRAYFTQASCAKLFMAMCRAQGFSASLENTYRDANEDIPTGFRVDWWRV